MGWQLRALARPVEDLVQFPKPAWQLTADREHSTRGWSELFWPLRTPDKQMVHRHTYRKHTCTLKLKRNKDEEMKQKTPYFDFGPPHMYTHVKTHT